MKPFARAGTRFLAVVLAWLIGAQSVLAAAGPHLPNEGNLPEGARAPDAAAARPFQLPAAAPRDLPGGQPLPDILPATPPLAPEKQVIVPVQPAIPAPQAAPKISEKSVGQIRHDADLPLAEVGKLSLDQAHAAAQASINALTGEQGPKSDDLAAVPQPASAGQASPAEGRTLAPYSAAQAQSHPKVKIPRVKRQSFFAWWAAKKQVFNKDPDHNSSFLWYICVELFDSFGSTMQGIAMPFLSEGNTINRLRQANSPLLNNPEALKGAIWHDQSLYRGSHWIGNLIGLMLTPILLHNSKGNLKWLAKSDGIRAVSLFALVGLFYAIGLLNLPVAFGAMNLVVAFQGSFQSVSNNVDSLGQTRLMGEEEQVTAAERRKANILLLGVANVMGVIAPYVVGLLSRFKEHAFLVGGKLAHVTGVDASIIYGIFAGVLILESCLLIRVKVFNRKETLDYSPVQSDRTGQDHAEAGIMRRLRDVLREGLMHFQDVQREGLKLIRKDLFLWTMLQVSAVSALFSDTLGNIIMPAYAEQLAAAGTVAQALLHVPVLGGILQCMMDSGLGYYSLLKVAAGIGGLLSLFFLEALCRGLHLWGWKSEESQALPIFLVSFLGALCFLGMIASHSGGVLLLYGAQAFFVEFGAVAQLCLMQMKQGAYSHAQRVQIMTATTLVVTASYAAGSVIASFWHWLFPYSMMTMAAVATVYLSLFHLAGMISGFTKEERKNYLTRRFPKLAGFYMKKFSHFRSFLF